MADVVLCERAEYIICFRSGLDTVEKPLLLFNVSDVGRFCEERGRQASSFVVVLCRGNGLCVRWGATAAVAVCTCLRFNASWLATSATCCQSSGRDTRYINKITSRSLGRQDYSNCARLGEAIRTKIHHRVVSRCLLRNCGWSAGQHHRHDVETGGGLKTVMLCLMSHATLMDSINFARAAVGVI